MIKLHYIIAGMLVVIWLSNKNKCSHSFESQSDLQCDILFW